MLTARLDQLKTNINRLMAMQVAISAVLDESQSLLEQTAHEAGAKTLQATAVDTVPLGWDQPYIDKNLLAVVYRGRRCVLGETLLLRLLERLLRRPNQYLSHRDLLDHVWFGIRDASTIRSGVKELRAKLRAAGMADLATAIDGRRAGHYGFLPDRLP